MKKLFTDTLSFAFLRVVTIILNLVAIPIYLEYLGADGYGTLLLSQGLLGAFLLLDAGIGSGTTRFVAKYRGLKDNKSIALVIGTSEAVYAIIGLIACLLLLLAFSFSESVMSFLQVKPQYSSEFRYILLFSSFFSLIKWPARGVEGAARGEQLFKPLNYGKVLLSLATVISGIILAYFHYSIATIFIVQQLFSIPLWILLLVLVLRKIDLPMMNLSYNKDTLKEIYGFSVWSFINKSSSQLLTQFDTIIVAALLGTSSVAVYNILKAPIVNLSKLMDLTTSAITPLWVQRFYEKGSGYLMDASERAGNLLNSINAILCIAFAFLIKPFLLLWVGQEYVQYSDFLVIAVILLFLSKSTMILYQTVVAIGDLRNYSLISVFTSLACIALTYCWVEAIGPVGAILATYSSVLAAIILYYILVFGAIGIDRTSYLLSTTSRPLIMLAIVCVAIWFFNVDIDISEWWIFILMAGGISAMLGTVAYFLLLSSANRSRLLEVKGGLLK